MRFSLLPTDDKFFELFVEAATNAEECSRLLRDLLAGSATGDVSIDPIIACEQRGDELTRTIVQRLGTSFVTPFDREDIHALAEELDDAVDDMLEVAYRVDLTDHDTNAMPELKQQADVLAQIGGEVMAMVAKLEKMQGLQEHLDAVARLESEADAIYRQALRRLYSEDLPVRAAFYWKDVVEAMEDAIDAMEDISDVVEGIVLKHS